MEASKVEEFRIKGEIAYDKQMQSILTPSQYAIYVDEKEGMLEVTDNTIGG
jgi:hypothetical protein